MLPAYLWLALRKRRPCEPTGARLTVGTMALHLAILAFLILHFDYLKLFSLRHVMVLAALTLPFSAAGVAIVLDLVPVDRRRLVMMLLAVGLIGPTLPWMLETRFVEAVHVRRAGEWIRQQEQGVPRIMTTRHLAALYANGVHIWCPWDLDAPWVLAEARQRRPNWMMFENVPNPEQAEAFFKALGECLGRGEQLERVHETAGDGPKAHRAIIFRYHPPS